MALKAVCHTLVCTSITARGAACDGPGGPGHRAGAGLPLRPADVPAAGQGGAAHPAAGQGRGGPLLNSVPGQQSLVLQFVAKIQ